MKKRVCVKTNERNVKCAVPWTNEKNTRNDSVETKFKKGVIIT